MLLKKPYVESVSFMGKAVIKEREATMKELEDCIFRQAESRGLSAGSEEFEKLVIERIVNPENRMMKVVRSDNLMKNNSLKTDYYLPAMDLKLLHRQKLRNLCKWAKLNNGIHPLTAARILGVEYRAVEELGRQAAAMGLGNFYETHITGLSDDTSYAAFPELMSDGCRQT